MYKEWMSHRPAVRVRGRLYFAKSPNTVSASSGQDSSWHRPTKQQKLRNQIKEWGRINQRVKSSANDSGSNPFPSLYFGSKLTTFSNSSLFEVRSNNVNQVRFLMSGNCIVVCLPMRGSTNERVLLKRSSLATGRSARRLPLVFSTLGRGEVGSAFACSGDGVAEKSEDCWSSTKASSAKRSASPPFFFWTNDTL